MDCWKREGDWHITLHSICLLQAHINIPVSKLTNVIPAEILKLCSSAADMMLSYRTGCPLQIKEQFTILLAFYSLIDPQELPIQQACFYSTTRVQSVIYLSLFSMYPTTMVRVSQINEGISPETTMTEKLFAPGGTQT